MQLATSSVRFAYRTGDLDVDIDLEGTHPDEHILRAIRDRQSFYESDLLEHLSRNGPGRGVYVDVGANIGNHSVFFGRFLADHVVAIEPNPALLCLLERNLRVNGVTHWTALRVAIGSSPGAGRLVPREGFEGNDGAQHVVASSGRTDGASVDVDTLDHVLAELGPGFASGVRLVKLDIEGMEMDALRGAPELLEHQGPDIVVEAAADAEHARVRSFLADYGYCEIARFCNTPTYHFSRPDRPWGRRPQAPADREHL
jgi:FkbM family methyltransferase